MVTSAYIHIPFCKSKCNYCSFVSYNRPELQESYISALKNEIKNSYKGEKLRTLYFGGGTPSLLPIYFLKEIIQIFNFNNDYELTFELNPDDGEAKYLNELRKLGVNRLSIGSQTFDDGILKLIGRRHNSKQISKVVDLAKEAGFENVSVDLIYGLPMQTLYGLKKDLEKFLSLGIQHISTYGLKIEEESFWGKNFPKNLPSEDEQADMYELVNDVLEREGFYRYEVSNFAKTGYESQHNLNYWNNEEYYGFGVSAHGYENGVRYSNSCVLEDYISNPEKHISEHKLSIKEKLEEEIFLGFRKRDGISVEKIQRVYGIDFEQQYKYVLEKYADYIEKTQEGWALNQQGTLLSNVILAEFI